MDKAGSAAWTPWPDPHNSTHPPAAPREFHFARPNLDKLTLMAAPKETGMTVETGSVDIAGRNPSTASLLIDGNHQPPDDDGPDSGPGRSGA